ncbi:MAG: hypothetical protein AAGC67_00025 [Myxococcota bacterium]
MLVAYAALLAVSGCSGLPPHPEVDERAESFSPQRARAHYAALAGLGTRPPGSESAERARRYVERELRWAGAEPVQGGARGADRPVLAWLPGASEDRILVVAPWSPGLDGALPDDAGVAVLLELARALARQPAPYRVGLAAAIVPPIADARPQTQRAAVRASGTALVAELEADGGFEGLRAVLVLEPRVRGGTRVVRDLRSHPVFRDLFWQTAARLGHDAAFPEDGGWATPEGIQAAFLSAGYGRVLSLVDEGSGLNPTGASAMLPDPIAFEPVGAVAYEGLIRLMGRLARVDAFSP